MESLASQTTILLLGLKATDAAAKRRAHEELLLRFRPRLAAWLRQRVPKRAHSLEDTQDVVQDVCIKAFEGLERFEQRGIGSFWRFLRTAAKNQLIDVARRHRHEDEREPLAEDSRAAPAARAGTPLDDAERAEVAEAFERALDKLRQKDERLADAVMLRLELDVDYKSIAAECGFPSEDAARVAIARAVTVVAREMKAHGAAQDVD